MICSRATHERMKRDGATWDQLPPGGFQAVPAGDGEPEELLELRHCTCGSTLAKVAAAEPVAK